MRHWKRSGWELVTFSKLFRQGPTPRIALGPPSSITAHLRPPHHRPRELPARPSQPAYQKLNRQHASSRLPKRAYRVPTQGTNQWVRNTPLPSAAQQQQPPGS
ncbi:hypothetical protein IG631_14715 [Alternaria alternata]|nr:hypothetical protein IG631_14715 [Alternaria alternata]